MKFSVLILMIVAAVYACPGVGAGPALESVEDDGWIECVIRAATIEVTIDGIGGKLNALVDPGATVNAISHSLVSHLRIELTQSPPLKLADGTTSKTPIGEIVLNVSWDGQNKQVKFLVLGAPSPPIILGTNWIARVGVTVSLSEKGVMEAKAGGLKLSDLKKDTRCQGAIGSLLNLKEMGNLPPRCIGHTAMCLPVQYT